MKEYKSMFNKQLKPQNLKVTMQRLNIWGDVFTLHDIHIICIFCNKVIETEDTVGCLKEIKKITNRHNFQIEDFNLSIKGVCNVCQKET